MKNPSSIDKGSGGQPAHGRAPGYPVVSARLAFEIRTVVIVGAS